MSLGPEGDNGKRRSPEGAAGKRKKIYNGVAAAAPLTGFPSLGTSEVFGTKFGSFSTNKSVL